MKKMDFINYFGFEDLLITVFEITVLLALLSTYFSLKKSAISSKEPWVHLLQKAVGFFVLSILLPLIMSMVFVLVLEDSSDMFWGIITIACLYVPLALGVLYVFKLGKLACSKA
ncbi:hypothetical protein [Neptuniibacter sp. QD37_11]|uniref:hypothetical protein n=1 Tax=Neptuniibacter sp. QD37_11 TaxID=3398209 RepID=UPI0039F4DA90